jgi:heat shock protein HslJ
VRRVWVCLLAVSFVFVSSVLGAACGGDDDDNASPPPAAPPPAAPPASARDLSDRTFVATDVTGHDLVAGTSLTLAFPNPAALNAQAGCNTINGPFEVDGDVLVAHDLATTLMGCAPELQAQDDWLVAFLQSRPTFTLAGDQLVLTGQDATITLREQR